MEGLGPRHIAFSPKGTWPTWCTSGRSGCRRSRSTSKPAS
jgi:hypothetical protein